MLLINLEVLVNLPTNSAAYTCHSVNIEEIHEYNSFVFTITRKRKNVMKFQNTLNQFWSLTEVLKLFLQNIMVLHFHQLLLLFSPLLTFWIK